MRSIALATVAVLFLATTVPAQTIKGDARAWEEIQAAYKRLADARTYRMTMSFVPGVVPQGFDMGMTSEVVAPDRSRMTMRQADIAVQETVVVGREMRRRTTLLPRGQQMYDAQRSAFTQSFGLSVGNIMGWITNPIGMAIGMAISQIASRAAQAATAGEEPGKWKCMQLSAAGSSSGSSSQGEITVTKIPDGTVEGARTHVYEMTVADQGRTGKTRLHVLAERGLPRRMEMHDDSGKHMANMDFIDVGAAITIELPPCEQ